MGTKCICIFSFQIALLSGCSSFYFHWQFVCTYFPQPYYHFMLSDLNIFLPVFSNILLFYFVGHWLLVSLLIFLFLNIWIFFSWNFLFLVIPHFCVCLFLTDFFSIFWICLPFYSSFLSTQKHAVIFPTWKKSFFNTMAFQLLFHFSAFHFGKKSSKGGLCLLHHFFNLLSFLRSL